MTKADFKKKFGAFYSASSKEPALVDVPEFRFAVVDGAGGDPAHNPDFQNAVAALYGVSYTIKFALKKARPAREYSVMPLEGLWWCEGLRQFDMSRPELWRWRLMIFQPDFVDDGVFQKAVAELSEKKQTTALPAVRLERFEEGRCVQMMHVGPYAAEPATIARMQEFAAGEGYAFSGRHHEIYMGDPRRAKPERLKTILRSPVTRVGIAATTAG